jgi:SAM-dependent methyltransferase
MHPSQYKHTQRAIASYLSKDRHIDVLDLGSATSPGQTTTNRQLLEGLDHSYLGVDVRDGNNVDQVMRRPYSIPVPARSKDLVLSCSVFEHIPYFWASMLEVARVLRSGGIFIFTAPSRGHKHTVIDCWRYYPDGIRAMAAATHLELLEVHTHYPPLNEKRRHDYSKIDSVNHYWGDTVAVFKRPERYPLRMKIIRPIVRYWANWSSSHGPLGVTPPPRNDCPL